MSEQAQHDVLVIGAGPGGYVCAIRCAQLGLNTAIIERAPALGGTCLRIGCIPTKALLESSHLFEHAHHLADHGIRVDSPRLDLPAMLKRKDSVVKQLTDGVGLLMKKNKIKVYTGTGSFNDDASVTVTPADGKGEPQTLRAKHVVIATGSRPALLPGIDDSQPNVDTSTDAIAYDKVPQKLVVIGAGYIGIELGSVWRRLGSEVTVLEYLDRILPGMDGELAREAEKVFKKQGLKFNLKTKVTKVTGTDQGVTIEVEGGPPVQADRVLVAVGRSANTEGLNIEAAGVPRDDRGRVKVDGKFRAGEKDGVSIFAIGDVVAGPMLAHKAEEEGVACAEGLAGQPVHLDYNVIPGIVYTEPEIATVGKSEEQLKDAGVPYRKGKFPFAANGRAKALGSTGGFVKVLAHEQTDRILGVHIIGPAAGDLIAECATAMAFGASSEDLSRACHAHPTLAEAVKEAALAVDGRALHA